MSTPASHTPKLLQCIAIDGEYKTERPHPKNDTAAAWRWANDMGSRWIFYPICVVTTPGEVIADVPRGMGKRWIGRKLRTLCKAIAENQDHAIDYLYNRRPFEVEP